MIPVELINLPDNPCNEKSWMNDYSEDEIQDFAEIEAENDYEANKSEL
jgi:hypothetical protein